MYAASSTNWEFLKFLSEIPDSGDLIARYDFRKEDGTTPVTDQTGNGNDLTNGSYTGVEATLGGEQAGEFNGGNSDSVYASFSSNYSPPYSIFFYFSLQQTHSSQAYIVDGASSTEAALGENNDKWQIGYAGSFDRVNPSNTNTHTGSGIFRDSNGNADFDIAGSQEATVPGDDNVTLSGLTINARGDLDKNSDILIREILVYDGDKSNKQSEIRNYLQ
jgi:hypothetical protein